MRWGSSVLGLSFFGRIGSHDCAWRLSLLALRGHVGYGGTALIVLALRLMISMVANCLNWCQDTAYEYNWKFRESGEFCWAGCCFIFGRFCWACCFMFQEWSGFRGLMLNLT